MIQLTLPYPPTVNTYWRRCGSRIVLSQTGRTYKDDVSMLCLANRVKPYNGSARLSVSIMVYPPDRRKRDIDNITKAVLDALIGHCYSDDSQIDDLCLRRRELVKGGKVIVSIAQYAA
jgi:crossover junction endodeoxyribonuclease RusA